MGAAILVGIRTGALAYGWAKASRQRDYLRKDFSHLEEATGPAVGHDERHGIGTPPSLVNAMKVETVHFRLVMVEAVELFLLNSPIEVRAPVLYERFEVIQSAAVVPLRAWNLIGKMSVLQTSMQVFQNIIWNLDCERSDLHGCSSKTGGLGYGVYAIDSGGSVVKHRRSLIGRVGFGQAFQGMEH